jgi:hypothetical protein
MERPPLVWRGILALNGKPETTKTIEKKSVQGSKPGTSNESFRGRSGSSEQEANPAAESEHRSLRPSKSFAESLRDVIG